MHRVHRPQPACSKPTSPRCRAPARVDPAHTMGVTSGETESSKTEEALLRAEFTAEDELIEINPMVRTALITLIRGSYGPFEPSITSVVPLWLALSLKKVHRCKILPPNWLRPGAVEELVADERREEGELQKIPFHFFEVSCLSLAGSSICFACYHVRMLTILRIRFRRCCSRRRLTTSRILRDSDGRRRTSVTCGARRCDGGCKARSATGLTRSSSSTCRCMRYSCIGRCSRGCWMICTGFTCRGLGRRRLGAKLLRAGGRLPQAQRRGARRRLHRRDGRCGGLFGVLDCIVFASCSGACLINEIMLQSGRNR